MQFFICFMSVKNKSPNRKHFKLKYVDSGLRGFMVPASPIFLILLIFIFFNTSCIEIFSASATDFWAIIYKARVLDWSPNIEIRWSVQEHLSAGKP